MSTFAPRPLRIDELPGAGDLFFQRGSQLMAVLIRFATGSDINHTGVIIESVSDGIYTVAEANAPGFELAEKLGLTGYIVRVSDDPAVRAVLVASALELAAEERKYDYLAIVRFAAIVFRRSRPSTLIGKLILGLPALALRAFGAAMVWALPNESDKRVICSGAVRRLLRETFGEDGWATSLPARDDETSPADLLASIYGRRRW